jgi:chromosome partitioning protein
MAIRSILALIMDAQAKHPAIQAGIVLNMIKPRSGITKEVSGLLESMGIPVLGTMIHDRVSITRSSITGEFSMEQMLKQKKRLRLYRKK